MVRMMKIKVINNLIIIVSRTRIYLFTNVFSLYKGAEKTNQCSQYHMYYFESGTFVFTCITHIYIYIEN